MNTFIRISIKLKYQITTKIFYIKIKNKKYFTKNQSFSFFLIQKNIKQIKLNSKNVFR